MVRTIRIYVQARSVAPLGEDARLLQAVHSLWKTIYLDETNVERNPFTDMVREVIGILAEQEK